MTPAGAQTHAPRRALRTRYTALIPTGKKNTHVNIVRHDPGAGGDDREKGWAKTSRRGSAARAARRLDEAARTLCGDKNLRCLLPARNQAHTAYSSMKVHIHGLDPIQSAAGGRSGARRIPRRRFARVDARGRARTPTASPHAHSSRSAALPRPLAALFAPPLCAAARMMIAVLHPLFANPHPLLLHRTPHRLSAAGASSSIKR